MWWQICNLFRLRSLGEGLRVLPQLMHIVVCLLTHLLGVGGQPACSCFTFPWIFPGLSDFLLQICTYLWDTGRQLLGHDTHIIKAGDSEADTDSSHHLTSLFSTARLQISRSSIRYEDSLTGTAFISSHHSIKFNPCNKSVSVCMCVYVRERETERF